MEWLSLAVAAAGIATAVWAGICGFRISRNTSLATAWRWLLAAEFAAIAMTVTDPVANLWPGRTADYGWCLAAILLLCPPVAVLGARRPGVRIWSAFILLPMVLVLSWPIWTILLQGGEWRGLALESPTIAAFAFVLLMGAGNYLGTRFTFPAVMYVIGGLMLFATCTGSTLLVGERQMIARLAAVTVLEVSAVAAIFSPRRGDRRNPVNRLWYDFRDRFGLLWSLRMVERINALAMQEHWTARISLDGINETAEGRITFNETEIATACRWLFRRFVDEAWIVERLGPLKEPNAESQTPA